MKRLIAIMLGRLEMDVDECISRYNELMRAVFQEKSRKLPVTWKGKTAAQFDSEILKSSVIKVIQSKGGSSTDLFNDGEAHGCRT